MGSFACTHLKDRQAHREGGRRKGDFRITAGGTSRANGLKRGGIFCKK